MANAGHKPKPDPARLLVFTLLTQVNREGAYANLRLPELLQEVATVIGHGGLWAGPDLIKRLVAATSAALATLPAPIGAPGATAQTYAKVWASLSQRETQVAQCVALGKSNREVAEQLFISERTVKAHLGSIFEKLMVRDRLQLALLVASVSADTRAIVDATT